MGTPRTSPSQVLELWFADALASPRQAGARAELWFGKDDEFDRRIRDRFGALPELAAQGRLDAWREEASSALALVLVLDQFPRNLYRGSARAFAFDSQALAVALAAIERGFDGTLHAIQASFLYLPLEHAEDIEHQERVVRLFEELTGRAAVELRPMFESFTSYARRHRDVIRRFGRFPYRNAVLNRASTQEETAYLESGGDRFG